ncbi:hypothetical protein [Marinitoga sp. 1155]|uniref:hypothetical protein n=1 Tax=Marinitoga sp. 1155 TaxID=1428448 RepID=UPI00064151EC|nr:hypothetical protein [Marinitoga sp. 1155]KLO23517.1 hypothetical protein X274_06420 [Marinitoga sp. 1155]
MSSYTRLKPDYRALVRNQINIINNKIMKMKNIRESERESLSNELEKIKMKYDKNNNVSSLRSECELLLSKVVKKETEIKISEMESKKISRSISNFISEMKKNKNFLKEVKYFQHELLKYKNIKYYDEKLKSLKNLESEILRVYNQYIYAINNIKEEDLEFDFIEETEDFEEFNEISQSEEKIKYISEIKRVLEMLELIDEVEYKKNNEKLKDSLEKLPTQILKDYYEDLMFKYYELKDKKEETISYKNLIKNLIGNFYDVFDSEMKAKIEKFYNEDYIEYEMYLDLKDEIEEVLETYEDLLIQKISIEEIKDKLSKLGYNLVMLENDLKEKINLMKEGEKVYFDLEKDYKVMIIQENRMIEFKLIRVTNQNRDISLDSKITDMWCNKIDELNEELKKDGLFFEIKNRERIEVEYFSLEEFEKVYSSIGNISDKSLEEEIHDEKIIDEYKVKNKNNQRYMSME